MRRWFLVTIFLLCGGCFSQPPREVVVYTSLDSDSSIPILKNFTKETGILIQPKFDTEETKTVDMAEAIAEEAEHPRCDVFWNEEILFTIRLKRRGLLEPYRPAIARAYPAIYRDSQGYWYGFAARARVLIVNTKLVAKKDWPKSILDFVDPKWRGQAAAAEPLHDTSATHVACLFTVWGDVRAKEFFLKLKSNDVRFFAGNKPVAQAVGAGQVPWGLTDSDDAIAELESGKPVVIVYPDQEPGGLGTLFIPSTVAIIRGCQQGELAREFIDYMLSSATEEALAKGPSAQIPLNPDVKLPARVETPMTVHAMKVDFEAAAEKWDHIHKFLVQEFSSVVGTSK